MSNEFPPASSGSGASDTSSFITSTDESSSLTSSRRLVDGTNTTVDTSVAGQVKVNVSGGGVTSVTGTANQIGSTGGSTPVISIVSNPVISGTASIQIPSGTTAQRPSPVNGQIRFNTSQAFMEYQYNAGGWAGIPRMSQGPVSGNYFFPNGGDLELPAGNVANRTNSYAGVRMNDTSGINGTDYGFLEWYNSEIYVGSVCAALNSTTGDQEAAKLPAGNTASRPSAPVVGYFRWNTETSKLELWDGSVWKTFTAD